MNRNFLEKKKDHIKGKLISEMIGYLNESKLFMINGEFDVIAIFEISKKSLNFYFPDFFKGEEIIRSVGLEWFYNILLEENNKRGVKFSKEENMVENFYRSDEMFLIKSEGIILTLEELVGIY